MSHMRRNASTRSIDHSIFHPERMATRLVAAFLLVGSVPVENPVALRPQPGRRAIAARAEVVGHELVEIGREPTLTPPIGKRRAGRLGHIADDVIAAENADDLLDRGYGD